MRIYFQNSSVAEFELLRLDSTGLVVRKDSNSNLQIIPAQSISKVVVNAHGRRQASILGFMGGLVGTIGVTELTQT
ncbi:MAG: hypothetical protein WCH46_07130 [bacterium]